MERLIELVNTLNRDADYISDKSLVTQILATEGPVAEGDLVILKAYLERCDVDEFEVDLFLFHQLFELQADHVLPIFHWMMSLRSFAPEKYSNHDVFELLSLEILNGTTLAALSVELLTRVLYAVNSRSFIPDIFYTALDSVHIHKDVLLCGLLSSCHGIPHDVVNLVISDLLELVSESDADSFYRIAHAILEACNAGFSVGDSVLSSLADTGMQFMTPALCQVITHIISFMENPLHYQDWMLEIIMSEEGPIFNAAVESWMRCFEKWEAHQNAIFADIVEDRIPSFEFRLAMSFFDSITDADLFYRENIMTKCIDLLSNTPSPVSCLKFVCYAPDKEWFMKADILDSIIETIETGDEEQQELANEIYNFITD